MFLKTSQNSWEATCAGHSFNKVAVFKACKTIKQIPAQVFSSEVCDIFAEHDCFKKNHERIFYYLYLQEKAVQMYEFPAREKFIIKREQPMRNHMIPHCMIPNILLTFKRSVSEIKNKTASTVYKLKN